MTLLERFLHPATVSLKICGVTSRDDAQKLVELGVDALGVNFWPESKRYLAPEHAAWLLGMAGKILRVGVFVNSPPEVPLRLFREGLLDAVQLHGDESPREAEIYHHHDVPFFKAFGVKTRDALECAMDFSATAILLDAHAPGIYGGTGETFDWSVAVDFKSRHPDTPLILAGGITADNAATAAGIVRPAALDVASGAELSPGTKDFRKVAALLAALKNEDGKVQDAK